MWKSVFERISFGWKNTETIDEPLEIHSKFKEVHRQLQSTYFEHLENQRVCENAMEILWNVDVRRIGPVLLSLSTMTREVLTHADCNLKELHFITEEIRQSCREQYWEQAHELYQKIFQEMDDVWDDPSSLQRLFIASDFCTIFSYFKDIANPSVIDRCQRMALTALSTLSEDATNAQKQEVTDYVDAIGCVYLLRNDLPWGKSSKKVEKIEPPIVIVQEPEDDEKAKIGEEVLADTMTTDQYYDEPTITTGEDEFYEEIMETDGNEEYRMDVEIISSNQQYAALMSEETEYWTSNITLELIADAIYLAARNLANPSTVYQPARRQSSATSNYLSNTELMRRLSIMERVRIEPSHQDDDESDDEGAETSSLKPFDPLRVLEQHRNDSQSLELPVIGRSPDTISSFRRRGLFDAPTIHRARDKRVSEGESEARDSKGRRRDEMDDVEGFPVEIELTQCDTPMNTPYEPSSVMTREIDAGVFEGLTIRSNQCDTPQNTPYSSSYLQDLPNHSHVLMD